MITYIHNYWLDYIRRNNIENDVEDEDEDDIPPTMTLPLKDFIEFQSESIYYYNNIHSYIALSSKKADIKYYVLYNKISHFLNT